MIKITEYWYFFTQFNITHTRYGLLISLKTLQVRQENCAQLLAFVSILLVFEVFGTQKSRNWKNVKYF